MRRNFILFALIFVLTGALFVTKSQANDFIIVSYDSLVNKKTGKSSGISLDGLWKFHPGDNMEWAKPDFDDSDWRVQKSDFDPDSIKKLGWKGIGWFRIKIKPDFSIRDRVLGLAIYHMGASEIYLDGKLVHAFGSPSDSPENEKVAIPDISPLPLFTAGDSVRVLAIRYSNHFLNESSPLLSQVVWQFGFISRLGDVKLSMRARMDIWHKIHPIQLSLGGIMLALAFAHILIYFFYKKYKANLYYSIFGFTLSTITLLSFHQQNTSSVSIHLATVFIQLLAVPYIFIVFCGLLFSIYYPKMPRRYYFYLILGLLTAVAILITLDQNIANSILGIVAMITLVDSVIMIYRIARKKMDGAWIILGGALGFVLIMSSNYFIILLKLSEFIGYEYYAIIEYMGYVSLPVAMSLYLARDIAKTNKALELKIGEIQALSEHSIKQERHAAELLLEKEREASRSVELELRAQAAELQAKASEAQALILKQENLRKAKELDEARKLQLSMLPAAVPSIPGYEFGVYMQTATEVGGDYYDFYLEKDGTLTIATGDATGHGVKAGLMVTATKSVFTNLTKRTTPLQFLNEFSVSIKEMNLGSLYMCLLIGKLKNDTFQYASAGMPQVLVYRNNSGNIEEIISRGMPLGSSLNFPYEQKEIRFEQYDTMLLMSDGFIEMFNDKKEMFGVDRVKEVFLAVAKKPAREIIDSLAGQVSEWCGGNPPDDDVSFVVVKKTL